MNTRFFAFHFIFSIASFTLGAILKNGNPLLWNSAKTHLHFIRYQGINQFLSLYTKAKGIVSPEFLWGDEIEYGIFAFNDTLKHYDISLRSQQIRSQLTDLEKEYSFMTQGCNWQPEYGDWMVESVPRDPYTGFVSDLLKVEKMMQLRRQRLHFALEQNEIAPSMSVFPMLGVSGYPHTTPNKGPIANSEYLSDRVINPHPRFQALTANIRARRQSNVNIEVPLESVSRQKDDRETTGEGSSDAPRVHMDAMAFGMGCCCLQVTLQCRSEFESRLLADQLTVLSPMFLALSAATPILVGTLS